MLRPQFLIDNHSIGPGRDIVLKGEGAETERANNTRASLGTPTLERLAGMGAFRQGAYGSTP